MRRVALAAAFFLSLTLPAFAAPDVAVAQGALSGTDEDGISVFKDIPFAAPPVGALRWRAPQPAADWQGVRDASKFGPACMQDPAYPIKPPQQSEDCLSVNVWSPKPDKAVKLPVMVWIYGGAFRIGSANTPLYDGTDLAKHGVVVVTFNYRLGWFGFFAHPALKTEDSGETSGNFGLMDQIAALKWVRDNIANFGGDSSNVTIFGESAGGMSVNDLIASPKARGLFAKAISESGLGLNEMPMQDEVASADTAFAARMGITGTSSRTLAELRRLPAAEIARDEALQDKASKDNIDEASPMVDGTIVPDQISVLFAKGDIAHVPYIAGSNSNEATLMDEVHLTPESMIAALGDKSDFVRKVYEQDGPLTDKEFARQIFGDSLFASAAQGLAAFVAKTGEPAYAYQFAYIADALRSELKGVGHAGELAYVWGLRGLRNDPYFGKIAAEASDKDQRMVALVQDYWTNFAKSGDPNFGEVPGQSKNIVIAVDNNENVLWNGHKLSQGEAETRLKDMQSKIPEWPEFSAAAPKTLVFDDETKPMANFRKAQIELSFAAWGKRTGLPPPF